MVPWLRQVHPGVPVALYYHGGEVPLVRRMEDDVAARAFAMADVVFTNTEFSLAHAVERGCPPERAAILPVGFPLEDYLVPPGREYRPDGILRLVSAGRMSEEKGIIYALEALKLVIGRGERRIVYSLTGEGYLRPKLEAYVRENGLTPHVRFLGVLSTAGVLEAMAGADALLLPSIQVGNWVENQACAVQEAMLMGALVITSRTGGVPESIPPQMRRFVVPPGDSAALADAILRLAAMPVAELRSEAAACRRFVVERYDVARLDDELLETTLQARRGGRAETPTPAQRARTQPLDPFSGIAAAEG
jgi:glycosyltransferase involved in cell wall biosynthesis